MIFAAKNETDTPSWQMVLDGKKTVTRRIKPLPVGKVVAVQPGRGKKQVCKIKIISCMHHTTWAGKIISERHPWVFKTLLEDEARMEGFMSWPGVCQWFWDHRILMINTFRIQFVKIKEGENERNGKY